MSNQNLVIQYRESELRFRNAWARRRFREAMRQAVVSLAVPLFSYPMATFLMAADPYAAASPARHFLQAEQGVFSMFACAAGGVYLAVLALANSRDARVGRAAHYVGAVGLILNGGIVFLMLSVLMLGVPWKIIP